MKTLFFLCGLLFTCMVYSQAKPIKIVEERLRNRLSLYALNETYTDYDVKLTVKGTNFRQSAAKPRLTRVPSGSKVLMKTLILLRDKEPLYSYNLVINDSLSRRALKREFTKIEIPPKMIKPKKHITIYNTTNCYSCDSIIANLKKDLYIFRQLNLDENPDIKTQLEKALGSKSLDSLATPIVNLGGHLYTWISEYDQLLEELNKE